MSTDVLAPVSNQWQEARCTSAALNPITCIADLIAGAIIDVSFTLPATTPNTSQDQNSRLLMRSECNAFQQALGKHSHSAARAHLSSTSIVSSLISASRCLQNQIRIVRAQPTRGNKGNRNGRHLMNAISAASSATSA